MILSPNSANETELKLDDDITTMSEKSVNFNSSSPSAAYMRQWIGSALVQILARRLFGAKQLSKPMLVIVDWTIRNKLQWNFNLNSNIFIHENACENVVCDMAVILSGGRWVKAITRKLKNKSYSVLINEVFM